MAGMSGSREAVRSVIEDITETSSLIRQMESRRNELVAIALSRGHSVRDVAAAAGMSVGWVHHRRLPHEPEVSFAYQ